MNGNILNLTQQLSRASALCTLFGIATFSPISANAAFSLGAAANYAVLFEGGGNSPHLSINNGPGPNGLAVNGNIGIGGTGHAQLSGPLTIAGNIDFTGATSVSGIGGNVVVNGFVNANVANVQSALNTVNALSSTLGGEAGTSLTVNINNNQSQTINASDGALVGGNRIFTVSSFNFGGGSTLTVNGSASDYVVFNFSADEQFKGTILLTGGITSDQVLWNFSGGANLTDGDTLQDNSNGDILTGIFLNPNGSMSINHSVLNGRFFGGDSSEMSIVSGGLVNAPVPEPATFIAGALLLLPFGASTLRALRRKPTA